VGKLNAGDDGGKPQNVEEAVLGILNEPTERIHSGERDGGNRIFEGWSELSEDSKGHLGLGAAASSRSVPKQRVA